MRLESVLRRCSPALALLVLAGCTTVTNNNISATTQRNTDQQMQAVAQPPFRAGEVAAAPVAARPPAPAVRPVTPAELGVPLAELHRTYVGKIMLAGRLVPLPEGEWYLVGRAVIRGHGQEVNEELLLLRQTGSSVSGFLMYEANPQARPALGYRLAPSCSGSNFIYADVIQAVPDRRQDCYSIQFLSEAALRAPSAPVTMRALVDVANERNLVIPPTMLMSSFVEAGATHDMVFTLYLNPDLAGVPPEPSMVRAESGWASFNLNKDPLRAAYVDRLKAWSARWHEVMVAAFERGSVAVPPGAGQTP